MKQYHDGKGGKFKIKDVCNSIHFWHDPYAWQRLWGKEGNDYHKEILFVPIECKSCGWGKEVKSEKI